MRVSVLVLPPEADKEKRDDGFVFELLLPHEFEEPVWLVGECSSSTGRGSVSLPSSAETPRAGGARDRKVSAGRSGQ